MVLTFSVRSDNIKAKSPRAWRRLFLFVWLFRRTY